MDKFAWENSSAHVPVLLTEAIELLAPKDGGIYVDGTFGGGGYSKAIIGAARCRVVGFDRDPKAVVRARDWIDAYAAIDLLHACFGDMIQALAAGGISRIDGVVLDLGVSSDQIDTGERGFSFQHDGPLDMRMSLDGVTAADLLRDCSETELADIIYRFGGERASRRIGRAIVQERQHGRIETTKRLADIVTRATHGNRQRGGRKIHPATRTFQALRIAVNNELDELRRALEAAEYLLNDRGRLVVVTFHSGEDRIVKKFIDERSGRMPAASRHLPAGRSPEQQTRTFRPMGRRPARPDLDETTANPRARSAKLRAAERIRPSDEDADEMLPQRRVAA